ncbi:MAG: bifunctional diaminohydroxyphosphoribosylaminopyrimidine deaminase/5-amino-6-(5-phosphoribosylamino)uracil reductase RibD [Methylococcaceae bacterium]
MIDSEYMTRALQLARKGLNTTDPNPRVGCIIVKNQTIIGEGWHEYAGQPHAEVNALKNLSQDPKGATAYVTLEPCSHYGKTPPCCNALIEAGVSRVVVAMQDPNPLVAGRGITALKNAGIAVDCGVLEADAKALNRGFIQRMTTGKPFVTSKLAMSLDGRTALANGQSQWISSDLARHDVQYLRAQSSAIMTGINTVLADNPSLTVRLPDINVVQPIRVILDSQLQMPLTAKMAQLNGETWLLTCNTNLKQHQPLIDVGFKIFVLPEINNRLDLKAVIAFLGEKQINNVLIEAGAILNGALLTSNLIDEYIIYIAPCILGDEGRGLFKLPSALQSMNDKKLLQLKETRQVGGDLRLTLIAKSFLAPRLVKAFEPLSKDEIYNR